MKLFFLNVVGFEFIFYGCFLCRNMVFLVVYKRIEFGRYEGYLVVMNSKSRDFDMELGFLKI